MSKVAGKWQKVEWQPVIAGLTRDIPLYCFIGKSAMIPGNDPVFIFPGYGEERISIPTAVNTLEKRGIASIGVNLPDTFLRDKAILELSSREAPVAVAQSFNEIAGKAPDAKVDVVGHSKGAGVLLVAGREAPERFGALGLIGPIGVTNEYLGRSTNARILNYFWRLGVLNNLEPDHNPLKDRGNLVSFYEVATRIGKDVVRGTLKTKLDLAFDLNLAENIRQLSKDHPLRLFLGTGDRLFTLEEYRKAMGEDTYNDCVEEVIGSHSPITNRVGRQHIALAGDWIKAVRTERDQEVMK
ncbi:MAG TPA: hypothetical protein VMQ52_01745 [Candidatus Saccharimonadales bacterium]|jgi:hypothetical protein|nr:hypothetical protein [Candidatus Saccharimonadales bacterium]